MQTPSLYSVTYIRIILCYGLCLGLFVVSCTKLTPTTITSQLSTTEQPKRSISPEKKLSPFLSMLWKFGQHPKSVETQSFLRHIQPLTMIRTRTNRTELRLLFAYQGSKKALHSLGIYPDAQGGKVMAAWVPLASLRAFAALPSLHQASISRKLVPHLNVSAPLIYAPQVRHKYSVDGRNILVGLIDTGINFRHPSFRKSDGTTRLLAILDFSQDDPAQKEPPRLFTAAQINNDLQGKAKIPHFDQSGHGTHVAGIAVGNGKSEKQKKYPKYIGIAPQADIIMIKGLRANRKDFDSGDVLRGIQFIHQTARFFKRPYVINLSLGGQQGGHDGTTLLEQAISSFSGKNKKSQIIVASAGNEGSDPIHSSGWLRTQTPISLHINVPPYEKQGEKTPQTRVALELWLPSSETIEFSLQTPRGSETPWFSAEKMPKTSISTKDGVLIIAHKKRQKEPQSHRFSFLLTNETGTPLRSGRWTLLLRGNTPRFDLWVAAQTFPKGTGEVKLEGYVTQEMLIGVPGSTAAVLTVGSYNSREGWSNASGEVIQRPSIFGHLSSFSSPGPTRDGRAKPEVIAPGLYIAAPAPLTLDPTAKNRLSEGAFQILQGTSQAAPHLTGGVALMLQIQPELDTETIRKILIRNAHTDEQTTGNVYQKGWGFGKLNLLSTLEHLHQSGSKKKPDVTRSTLGALLSRLPADGKSQTKIILILKDKKGQAVGTGHTASLETNQGLLSSTTETSPGMFETTFTASSKNGTAIVTAKVDNQTIQAQTKIVLTSPSSDAKTYGCNCSSAKKMPSLSFWLLWLVVWFLWRRQRISIQKY